jgi:excisionase family DNA binding protein
VSDWLRESVAHRLGLPSGEPLPLTLSVEDAARVLGVSRGSAYEATRRGELSTVRIGRRKLVPTAKLLELLGEVSAKVPAGEPSPRPGPTPAGAEQ